MTTRRSKGEGSIARRHDHKTCPPAVDGQRPDHACQGRWVSVLDLGWSGGKRQRRTFYGATKKEAQIKLRAAVAKNEAGVLTASSAPTVEAWLNHWLDVICEERGLKINTLKSHRSKVETYLIPNLGRHRLDKLAPEHIRRMYAHMRERGLSEATLRQTHAILRRALEVAYREQKVAVNVATMMDPPKTTRKKRQGLTVDDARRVLAVSGLRWYCALYMGLRQSEALGLHWSDVDLLNGHLRIERTLVRKPGVGLVYDTPKSEASTRIVPIPAAVLARFRLARMEHEERGGGDDHLVFHNNGQPIDHRVDWKAWRDVLDLASMPPWAPVPQIALHAARNTTAKLLEEAGVPARMTGQILGQSTIEVTHGYQAADLGRMADAMRALDSYVGEG